MIHTEWNLHKENGTKEEKHDYLTLVTCAVCFLKCEPLTTVASVVNTHCGGVNG